MRTAAPAALAAALLLAAGLAFAGAPPKKPAASPAGSPAATPVAKPKEPEKNECTGVSKEGSYSAKASDYQACLREITNAVKAKSCVEGVKKVEFTFQRGGQKAMPWTAICD